MIHTDHGTITQLEYLPLDRIESKRFHWHAEIIQGGCILLSRPGSGAMHRVPDALSRHPPLRDQLNLARIGDWSQHREVIRSAAMEIESGFMDAEDPPPYTGED